MTYQLVYDLALLLPSVYIPAWSLLPRLASAGWIIFELRLLGRHG